MNKINKKICMSLLMAISFILIFLQACQDEFLPQPIGEPIAPGEQPDMQEVLKTEGYSLFKAAWDRSNIDEIIGKEASKNRLTFLVPNNEAMASFGYTEAEIMKADPKDLDTMIAYHILLDEISEQKIMSLPSFQAFGSLLTHNKYKEGVRSGANAVVATPYRYLHVLDKTTDGLLNNGERFTIEKEIPVKNGVFLGTNRIFMRPGKQMIDVIREDGRFSLFLKAMELNVVMYDDYTVSNLSVPAYVADRYLTDYNYITQGMYAPLSVVPHVVRFTLFAPTNEAFSQIGINSEADLNAINKRVKNQRLNRASTPLDSLLRYHRIAEAINTLDIDWDLFAGITVLQQSGQAANGVFYANNLNNTILGNYEITAPYATNKKKLEYDFVTDGSGNITIKHKGSTAAPSSVIEENINTIQGPVHVVNRLIVPKDFSMWHVK